MKRILLTALAAATVTASAAVATTAPANAAYLPGIKIEQCFVTVPKAMSKKASGTQIVYVNTTNATLTKITFAVGYRNSNETYLRKVVDQGVFGPGHTVNHHFALYNDVIFGGKTTTTCGAIAAQ